MTVTATSNVALSFLHDRLQSPAPSSHSSYLTNSSADISVHRESGDLHPYAVHEAVESLNIRLQAWSTSLRFVIDPDDARVVVTIVDTETGQTIRQIPSEEVVHISKEMGRLQDLAFKAEA